MCESDMTSSPSDKAEKEAASKRGCGVAQLRYHSIILGLSAGIHQDLLSQDPALERILNTPRRRCSRFGIVSVVFEMDPLSITATAIGITTFAITSIKQLHDIINDVAEVKEVIHDISASLTDILVPLDSLRELHVPDSSISAAVKADLEKAGVAGAVNKCGDLCDDFSKRLKKWTKHSSGAKLSLRDRLTVGLWNKEKIRALRTSIQSCQSTVQFAVQTTQL
jgi:hypothetical protein